MSKNSHVLFCLDDGSNRLAIDDRQWVLERGNPVRKKVGKDSGFRGISFVCSRKDILRRCIREKSIVPSSQGNLHLDALPQTYRECWNYIKEYGIEMLHARIEERVKFLKRMPEPSSAAATASGTCTHALKKRAA